MSEKMYSNKRVQIEGKIKPGVFYFNLNNSIKDQKRINDFFKSLGFALVERKKIGGKM